MVKDHFFSTISSLHITPKVSFSFLSHQVMVPFRFQFFLADLMHLVESGKIPMTRIDDAVERILRVKFASGLFEHPLSDGSLLGTVRCEVSFSKFVFSIHRLCSLISNGKTNCYQTDVPYYIGITAENYRWEGMAPSVFKSHHLPRHQRPLKYF